MDKMDSYLFIKTLLKTYQENQAKIQNNANMNEVQCLDNLKILMDNYYFEKLFKKIEKENDVVQEALNLYVFEGHILAAEIFWNNHYIQEFLRDYQYAVRYLYQHYININENEDGNSCFANSFLDDLSKSAKRIDDNVLNNLKNNINTYY